MWQDAESVCTNQSCSIHHQQTAIKGNIGLIPIHSTFKEIKYLGINPTQKVKRLYNQNFKPWKKDREKHWKVERYHMFLYNRV